MKHSAAFLLVLLQALYTSAALVDLSPSQNGLFEHESWSSGRNDGRHSLMQVREVCCKDFSVYLN